LPQAILNSKTGALLKAGPNANSQLVKKLPTGTNLLINFNAVTSGKDFLPVLAANIQQPVFIKADQVAFAAPKTSERSISVSFHDGPEAGVEVVSAESAKALADVRDRFPPFGTQVEIKGQYYQADNTGGDQLRLLVRQAAAVQAVTSIGYDASSVVVSSEPTADRQSDANVTVHLTGLNFPTKPVSDSPAIRRQVTDAIAAKLKDINQ
jgi:hypothetical protein